MTAPTTSTISSGIVASISSKISQTIPLLPVAFTRVLAKVLAGVVIILYKRGDFIGLQWFVRTASVRETTFNGETVVPLVEIGRQIGVGDPGEATQAELVIDITVTNQTGSLASGTQFFSSKNGVTYILVGSVILDAATKQGTIRAVKDQAGGDGAGTIGNLNAGDTLQFANPLANVERTVSVDSQAVTGADAEDLDTVYRQRVLDRFQKRPQGGALADYEQWGEGVEGIINVYPYTGDPGEIDVFSEATVASSGSADGIPTAAQLTAVKDSIELDDNGLPSRRPANAFVNSNAITRTSFDVDVAGIADVTDLAQVQADVTAALEAFFLGREPFINGLTIPPRKDKITSSSVISIVEDVVTAANGTFTTATFEVTGSGSPETLYQLGRGEKAKAANVTFS